MASIASLLNPQTEEVERYDQLLSPCSTTFARGYHSPPPRQKKQKVSKDAAVFTRGKIRGELRYPPCEYQSRELAQAHRQFEIHPMGHITEFPRHIPYNSEKKSFLEKTGRESFEGEMKLYWKVSVAVRTKCSSFPIHVQNSRGG